MDVGPADLPMPTLGRPAAEGPLTLEVSWQGRDYAITMVDVGLACCSVEVMAAALGNRSSRDDGALAHGPASQPVDVLVVSGTCTDVLAPAVRRLHESIPGTPLVVSFGACAASGGPYWDSYSVTNGVDQIIPVDVYVPGCPPPPEALLDGITSALAHRDSRGRS
jgi:NADH-quinone oxidoreductase subunit B